MDNVKILKPEDYEEPECLLCMDDKSVTPINTRRFIEKLDEYYGRNDYDGAEGTLNTGWTRRGRETICADSSPFITK